MPARPFNPQQKKAIEHEHGPMLVVAGAGTGKTTVLTERIARLIRRKLARPDEIVALTYTISAAREMGERVRKLLKGESARGLQPQNFHSYCFHLLQEHGRDFQVLDENDLKVFLRQRLHELPLNIFRKAADPGKFLYDLTEFFSRCQDELVSPEAYAAYVAAVKTGEQPLPRVGASKEELPEEEVVARCEEIAAVYARVMAMLGERNLGTFGMQITGAVALLRADAALLGEARAKARFILVDEFQDSNQALIELVRLLAGEEQNVFAVGDPDQAIYRFRGASAAAFDSFHRAFPSAQQVTLAENYRSLTPVLDIAYRVIDKNKIVPAASQLLLVRESLRSARSRQPEAPGAEPVALVVHQGSEHEAFEIAAEIEETVAAGKARYSDFCVLYRQGTHREEVVEELRRRGIPFVVEGLDALQATEVRDLLAAVRAGAAANDSAALLRFASRRGFGTDATGLREQLAGAVRGTQLASVLEGSAAGRKVLAALAELNRQAPPAQVQASTYIEAALRRFGIERSAPVAAFLAFVAKWQEKPIAERGTIAEFLEYLDLFRDFNGTVPLEASDNEDAVRLMTVHGAKGREFRHVYVVRAVTNSFPSRYQEVLFEFPHALRSDSAAPERDSRALHDEEERRLFYVAMTRAMDSLTLLAKRDRYNKPQPAGYLREIAASGPGPWTLRAPRPFTVDLAARAGDGLAEVSSVAPWLLLKPRGELAKMPLSASSIEAYETCPLKFKIRYDWRLPEEATGALHYGSVMHGVLKQYIEQVRAGNAPADEAVLQQFRAELAAAKFDDPLQRVLYERDGLRQLADFMAAWRAQAQPPEVLSTEKQFRVQIAGVTVTGRIDRIDRCADGGIAVVDYKTGKAKEQKDADASLQLSIYALATPLDCGLTPDRLVFYNLVTNTPVVAKRTKEKLQQAEEKVREVAQAVREERFEPKPGYHCRWCGYKDLCPATEERFVRVETLVKAGGVN